MKELTDEQLNQHLCEWLGWTVWQPYIESGDPEMWWEKDGVYYANSELPNHISGIEALGHVHEAEKRLLGSYEWVGYQNWLDQMTRHIRPRQPMWHATARQRVIAILRVVKPEIFK